jgi:hypothetical protein
VRPLQGETGGSRRVPDVGCEQDGEEEFIPFLRLPHVCASWCEAGHSREGEGRPSCFGYDELHACAVAVCLKFPCTARDALRSRGREFYNTSTQRLTQRWQKYVKKDRDFVEKLPHNCKKCTNHPYRFIAIPIIFFEKILESLISCRPSYVYWSTTDFKN